MPSTIIPFLSALQSGDAPTPPPVTNVPDAITDLSVSSFDDTSVTLAWSAPDDNGSAITDYTVQYKESSSGTWLTFSDGTSSTTGATVTGLAQLTGYDFRVAAVNAVGTGAYSNEVTQVTDAPFANDANTFFYNFTSDLNTINTVGDDTLAIAPNLLATNNSLVQERKDYQPLDVTGGINGNTDTARQMTFDDISDIANGTDGWYIAFNAQVDGTNSHILNISRNASTTPSRGQIYITGSRNFGVKADSADGGSPNWIGFTTNQITLGAWYTFEARLIADGVTTNPLTLWIDGVEQALSNEDAAAFAQFAATPPREVTWFNDRESDDSFDGTVQDFVFYNGNPSSTIRSEVSTYLQGVKP